MRALSKHKIETGSIKQKRLISSLDCCATALVYLTNMLLANVSS